MLHLSHTPRLATQFPSTSCHLSTGEHFVASQSFALSPNTKTKILFSQIPSRSISYNAGSYIIIHSSNLECSKVKCCQYPTISNVLQAYSSAFRGGRWRRRPDLSSHLNQLHRKLNSMCFPNFQSSFAKRSWVIWIQAAELWQSSGEASKIHTAPNLLYLQERRRRKFQHLFSTSTKRCANSQWSGTP